MKNYYKKDEWLIVEEGFHPEMNRESESIFSIGNGYMGQRANFEEKYSGETFREIMLQGSIILIKPVLDGGKMVILSILQKYLMLQNG